MNARAPSPQSPFSAGAVDQLCLALALYVRASDEARHDVLQRALTRLCVEAHAANAGPERLIVAVKTAWAHVHGIDKMNIRDARRTFEVIFDRCVESYYHNVP